MVAEMKEKGQRSCTEPMNATATLSSYSMSLDSPLKDLEECGRVKETGYVWMKLKAPYQHFFQSTNSHVSYAAEVTGYVEKLKMKKMSGIKSRQMFMWVPIAEMSMEHASSTKITFKTPMGIGKSFPVSAFETDDEEPPQQQNSDQTTLE